MAHPDTAPLHAILHQLEVGEASEGDLRDIQWCARSLREYLAQTDPDGLATCGWRGIMSHFWRPKMSHPGSWSGLGSAARG